MENLSKKLLLNNLVLGCCLLISCSGNENSGDNNGVNTSDTVSKTVLPPSMIKRVEAGDPNLNGNEYEEKYPNGVIRIKGYVLSGLREGQWMSFYSNGKPWSQSIYKKGHLNGPKATWYENGQMRYSGEYTLDQRSGKWTFWDESGKQQEAIDYTK